MGLSLYGCMRMVAELLLGHQTPCMLPRSISGVLGDSSGLCGPPWVKKWGHGGVWVLGPPTPRTAGRVAGSAFGRGTVRCDEKLFSFGCLCFTIHNGSGPNHGLLKTTCHRLKKRWDENTSLNKRHPIKTTPYIKSAASPVH
jgi:hypothetical protein